MAKPMLDQTICLKQSASDYLSQIYEISSQLFNLQVEIRQLLVSIHSLSRSAHKELDRSRLPSWDLECLNICQNQSIKLLREAANQIESYKGFEQHINVSPLPQESANDSSNPISLRKNMTRSSYAFHTY